MAAPSNAENGNECAEEHIRGYLVIEGVLAPTGQGAEKEMEHGIELIDFGCFLGGVWLAVALRQCLSAWFSSR